MKPAELLPNIAFITTGLGMGGAENQVVALADRFAALGHAVFVISLTGEPLVMPRHPDVRVESLHMERRPSSFLRAYARARRLLLAFSPQVVHSHMVHANLFARLLRLCTPMPLLVCTAHNTNEGGAARMWAYRLTDVLADITTNVSEDAVRCFIRRHAAPAGRMMAMPNGIDCDRFRFSATDRDRVRGELAASEDTRVLLAVGRFSEQKDYPNMLRAFAAVCDAHKDCVLWLAGTGGDQPLLERQAADLGIRDRVSFLGLRRDVPALMSAADIFVLSSAWEGLPLVIGEAMACERVVVSTDAGGIREWMDDTGYVVPVRNSAALSQALASALDLRRAESKLRGMVARKRVLERFSLDAVVARWLQLYRERCAPPEQPMEQGQHCQAGLAIDQRRQE
jgi:glycosyltransferase involved in cell wall biosynthesis